MAPDLDRCKHCGSTDTADDPMGALWCQRCDRVTLPWNEARLSGSKEGDR